MNQYRIIDSHAHMGPIWNFYLPFNNEYQMLENMDRIGVDTVVFSSNMAISGDVELGNRYTLDVCRRHPGRFLGQYMVKPNYPELFDREVSEYFSQKEIVGFKVHPELSGDYPVTIRWMAKTLKRCFVMQAST